MSEEEGDETLFAHNFQVINHEGVARVDLVMERDEKNHLGQHLLRAGDKDTVSRSVY